MGISFTWLQSLDAMIEAGAQITVECTGCHGLQRIDLEALRARVGGDYCLINRRCRCRLTPGCAGYNRFFFLLGVVRPLWDRETGARWIERDAVDSPAHADQPPCMCNRYERGDIHKVADHFSARVLKQINEGPSIIHPKDPGIVVRAGDDGLIVEQMTWGFPVILKGKSGQPLKPKPVNNARFDKLSGYWRRWTGTAHRCLIPTTRFAEAVGEKGKMTETWLSVTEQPIFAWAGLWTDSDEWGPVYTGVMTENAPELADIHDRSPVILDPGDWATWLNEPLADLYQYDRPYPAEKISVDRTEALWRR